MPVLKESLIHAFEIIMGTPATTSQIKQWNRENNEFMCTYCIKMNRESCSAKNERTLECSFCVASESGNRSARICSRIQAESYDRAKDELDIDDDMLENLVEAQAASHGVGNEVVSVLDSETDEEMVPESILISGYSGEVMHQAQKDSKRRVNSLRLDYRNVTQNLLQDFCREMIRKPSEGEVAEWNDDPRAEIPCEKCTNLGEECINESSTVVRCQKCRAVKRYCSKSFAEARTRTKKILMLDDNTFDLLFSSVNLVTKPAPGKKDSSTVASSSTGNRDTVHAQKDASASSRLNKKTQQSGDQGSGPQGSARIAGRDSNQGGFLNIEKQALLKELKRKDNRIRDLEEKLDEAGTETEARDKLQRELDRAKKNLRRKEEEVVRLRKEVECLKADNGHPATQNAQQDSKGPTPQQVQNEIAEHISLNGLKRKFQQLSNDCIEGKISRKDLASTCTDVANQLQEFANRRLDRIPADFKSIMDVLGGMIREESSTEESDAGPSRKRSRT
ncbi:hypothetical protein VKT23_008018 [Stygiomarasmius scandens]|uniref:Uncharacterized protein n=1 Tax=Marasmiellus scandens TaxID=2682957 RepID=A0ABR1JJ25_9AGAR